MFLSVRTLTRFLPHSHLLSVDGLGKQAIKSWSVRSTSQSSHEFSLSLSLSHYLSPSLDLISEQPVFLVFLVCLSLYLPRAFEALEEAGNLFVNTRKKQEDGRPGFGDLGWDEVGFY